MTETMENGVMDTDTGDHTIADEAPNLLTSKLASIQDAEPKINGIGEHGDNNGPSVEGSDVKSNGTNNTEEKVENIDETETENTASNGITETQNEETLEKNNEENTQDSGKSESPVIDGAETPVVLSDTVDSGDEVELVESVGSESPVTVNTDDASMDVDDDDDDNSNVVEISSNISVQSDSVVEIDANDSNNPSMISEDSSRDSVGSSNSGETIDSKASDNKDEDVVINVMENSEKKNVESIEDVQHKTEKNVESNKSDLENTDDSVKSKKKDASEIINLLKERAVAPAKAATQIGATSIPGTSISVSVPIIAGQQAPSIVMGGQIAVSNMAQIPVGAQIVQQGNQLGYLTRMGNQNLFVPVSSVITNTQQAQVKVPITGQLMPVTKPVPTPKSSKEMIEQMKWEMQNRIPDSHNWSVAFHPKKEELSSITSFLLELGHDVVKEAVYKDIIQIQTKKKDSGNLKPNEKESLEKMKTVYENTKKKVEHLQLKLDKCDGCKFQTESSVVMNYHKDFPHCDPSWETAYSTLQCAHCDFKTKVVAQFSFHMDTVHKLQAKLPEKQQNIICELCPLVCKSRGKLEKHRQKCVKHFKLNGNLQPYYHDVNFCMKTCYYKPKKPQAPKPAPAPPAPKPVPQARPAMHTRQQPGQQQAILVQTTRPNLQPPALLRQPDPRKPMNLQYRPVTAQLGQNYTVRPPPNLVRAPVQVQQSPQQPRPTRPVAKEMAGFEVCELCGGYVKDRQALRIHFYYAHKVEMPQSIFNRPSPPLICDVCQSKFWTTQGLSKHKSTLRHYSVPKTTPAPTNTGQTCFMCMRKVPHLFMHIEQVHGMTMKDLVAMKKCIMCGITANDKRALEVHMASVHGVLIKANDFVGVDNRPANKPVVHNQVVKTPAQPTQAPQLQSNKGPVSRRNLCVFCQIHFADNVQLTMHCIKTHATCKDCGMVVASSKSLENHNCKIMRRNCRICGLKNVSVEVYSAHIKTHVKPCKVRITKLTQADIEDEKDKIKREYKPQVISLDDSDDSDIEVVETKADKSKVETNNEKDVVEVMDTEPSNGNENDVKLENEKTDSEDKKETTESSKTEDAERDSDTPLPIDEIKSENEKDEKIDEVNSSKDSGEKEHDTNEKIDPKTEPTDGNVDNDDKETPSIKDEKIDDDQTPTKSEEPDDKLLDSENSNDSQSSKKRKLSESDIDEDALLSNDAEAKRPKMETNSSSVNKDNDVNQELVNDEDVKAEVDNSEPMEQTVDATDPLETVKSEEES